MAYLSPRELKLLDKLSESPVTGLDKFQAGKAIGINPFSAECFLHLLMGQGFATTFNGRYFITEKGIVRREQQQLPGMNL